MEGGKVDKSMDNSVTIILVVIFRYANSESSASIVILRTIRIYCNLEIRKDLT